MILTLIGILVGVGILATGWKFYQSIDWDEPPEPSPDLQGMHKRQAELQHIQDVLTEAYDQGKISQKALEEFNHFCDTEIAAMEAVETAWRNRPRTPRSA